jgi:hypothetical protein
MIFPKGGVSHVSKRKFLSTCLLGQLNIILFFFELFFSPKPFFNNIIKTDQCARSLFRCFVAWRRLFRSLTEGEVVRLDFKLALTKHSIRSDRSPRPGELTEISDIPASSIMPDYMSASVTY